MKSVLITGAGTGLGQATADYLSGKGYQVFGLVNRHDDIKDSKVIKIHTDITSDESVKACYEEVIKHTDHLDAIVNFAGYRQRGSLIEEDVSLRQKTLNVNVLGRYRINKTFFGLVEKVKGRIINISSECGIFGATPFNGFYTASKHAVERYSDALRRELCYLGVKVIKIRPGAFKTNRVKSTQPVFDKRVEKTTHYKGLLERFGTMINSNTGKVKDPIELAKLIEKVLTKKKPKIAYNINVGFSRKRRNLFSDKRQDKLYRSVIK